MEPWIPLMVAIVGAVAAVSVAFWNSRGESGEIRQLKAMNEIIPTLDVGSAEAKVFVDARDVLLVRVAARTMTAPARRTTAGWISILAIAAGGVILVLFLLYPVLDDSQARWMNAVASTAIGALGTGAGISAIRRSQQVAVGQLKRAETLLALMEGVQARSELKV